MPAHGVTTCTAFRKPFFNCVCVYRGYVLILRQITGKIPLRRENPYRDYSSTASTRLPETVVSV
eukprot:SAG11_NODE_516_length_8817_cov_2.360977_10_plen_63_part_01